MNFASPSRDYVSRRRVDKPSDTAIDVFPGNILISKLVVFVIDMDMILSRNLFRTGTSSLPLSRPQRVFREDYILIALLKRL